MNITNGGNIPIAKNQITAGTVSGTLRQGSGVNAGRNVTPGTDISGIGTLKSFDEAARQGYREEYSIWDAADSLWQQETQTFNLKDLDDPEKTKEFLENWRIQARWDLGIQGDGPSKEEVLNDYIQNLRQNGLSGEINWSGFTREMAAFKTMMPEELEDGLNYMASRYVAALDKLERNFSGEALTAQRAKLEEVYQAGKDGMINGYTQFLQENLGISDSDAQAIKDSFSAILTEKENAYKGAIAKVQENVSKAGADSVWLKNHDAYIASQLRAVGTAEQSKAAYSVQDLTAAGKVAKSYQTELFNASSCGRNEATLALNLSMADMQAEAMISKGMVSENMAKMLRNSRTQGHEVILAALDQALAKREINRHHAEPAGTYAPVDHMVFQGIYQAVMNAYGKNGDAAGAIRAGVSAGEKLTAQASEKAPKAARFGVSMKSYWQEFYNVQEEYKNTLWVSHFHNLVDSSKPRQSAYQKYISSWQNFLTSIGSGMDVRA